MIKFNAKHKSFYLEKKEKYIVITKNENINIKPYD